LIAFVVFVTGTAGILYGAVTVNVLGYETGATSAAIGLGIPFALIGFLMTLNFLWAVRLMRGMRRGERVIGRWIVPPNAFEAFRAADLARTKQGLDNDYRLPRRIPSTGLEVIFSNDAVLIGNFYYGLSSSGVARFKSAKLLTGTPMLEFDTRIFHFRTEPRVKSEDVVGVLRVPASPAAPDDARRVVKHFIDVIPPVMAVVGTIVALGGLILALLASWMDDSKKRRV